jgi:hypothetical protein
MTSGYETITKLVRGVTQRVFAVPKAQSMLDHV